MSNEQAQELFSSLKKMGMKLEFELNELIKKQLNKEELLLSASSNSAVIASMISQCRNMVELLSIPLNFPTKNDVARVAKLAIQVEEKVDQLDEQMMALSSTLADIKSSVEMLGAGGLTEKPDSPAMDLPKSGQNPQLKAPSSKPESVNDSGTAASRKKPEDSPAEKRRKARSRALSILLDNIQKNAEIQSGLPLKGSKSNGR
ncbi:MULTISPECIES: hypothetical protein [Bacillaceae]|uniref:Uncharacterized protein n=2 Tax=Bacillus infantis TaxID=324767 RepID=U5LEX9_9BACI|nr:MULTISPECIES: hypothetical protein [Bacillus]OXT15505.1 hypothetical protein B9K06_20530 [Bacillus sp. OG2]AGX06015.1 hypothetical protein N288_20845 [Bacillus infantis NRRL B-14911]EAR64171.1 hypothetical protein B14911_24741 [Bacillus sp. NRRL B-14911]MCK6207603.1 hypothetical protein [Bacillus infantis]MCP1160262.1 hypothetical protein [Bacillus infantis]